MASATSDLRLPSQLQDITTPWSHTKLYCLTTDTHVCKQLAQNGRGSNPRPMTLSRTSNAPTITPVHTTHDNKIKHMVWVKKSQVSLAIFTQWQKFYTPIGCSYLCKMTTFYSVISWLRQRYAIFKYNHLVSFYTFLEKREKLQYDYKGMTDLMWNAFLSARQCKILIEKIDKNTRWKWLASWKSWKCALIMTQNRSGIFFTQRSFSETPAMKDYVKSTSIYPRIRATRDLHMRMQWHHFRREEWYGGWWECTTNERPRNRWYNSASM